MEKISALEAELNEVRQRNQELLAQPDECQQRSTESKILIPQYILYLLAGLVVVLLGTTIYFALRRVG